MVAACYLLASSPDVSHRHHLELSLVASPRCLGHNLFQHVKHLIGLKAKVLSRVKRQMEHGLFPDGPLDSSYSFANSRAARNEPAWTGRRALPKTRPRRRAPP